MSKEGVKPCLEGLKVLFDEEKLEFKHYVKYRESADNETPNEIYKKVYDENKKYQFESDIYS